MQFQLAGLASGFDWRTMIDQLMAIERIPQERLRTEQKGNTEQVTALSTIGTKLDTLSSRLTSLKTDSLYRSKSTSVSDDSVNITASASTTASVGTYDFAVAQLATATRRLGGEDVGGSMGDESTVITNLRLAADITEGTFSINGQEISVADTDTLQDVFDAISAATSGVVTASYDTGTDKVTLTSSSGQLDLGEDGDTSNFLEALRLDQLELVSSGGDVTITSTRALGVVDLNSSIADSGIAGPIAGSGTLYINGVQIDFDADSESMQTLISRINESDAKVTMTYDSAADQFRIVNKQTGAFSMNVKDSGNGLLAALGLDGAADVGKDLLFSVDGGAQQSSRSNIITSEAHGLEGLTVTAKEVGSQTITIAQDSSELKAKINEFISAYNDIQDFILEKTKVTVEDDEVTAGVLARNREVAALDSSLRSLAFKAIDGMSGDIFRLEHLGIDFISGTSKLEIKDSSALDQALEGDLSKLEEFFMDGESSFAERMASFLDDFTASDGILDTQKETLNSRNSRIDAQIEEMERQLEFRQSALEAGFIAMERAQSQIQNQQAALSNIAASSGF